MNLMRLTALTIYLVATTLPAGWTSVRWIPWSFWRER